MLVPQDAHRVDLRCLGAAREFKAQLWAWGPTLDQDPEEPALVKEDQELPVEEVRAQAVTVHLSSMWCMAPLLLEPWQAEDNVSQLKIF